jgi:hypothetical protein
MNQKKKMDPGFKNQQQIGGQQATGSWEREG